MRCSGYRPAGEGPPWGRDPISLYELPPGQANCPCHYESDEEWLLVLDSDKIGIWTDGRRDNIMVRREAGVDYYDREVS